MKMPKTPTSEELELFKSQFPDIYKRYRRFEEALICIYSISVDCDGYDNSKNPSPLGKRVLELNGIANCACSNKDHPSIDQMINIFE